MDVKVDEMNCAMEYIYATMIDQSEVTNLLQEMKHGQGMEIGDSIQNVCKGGKLMNTA